MEKVFEFIGGRKMFLVCLLMILVALKNVLGLDMESIKWLATIAIGGAGAIAIEDGVKALGKPK